MHDEFLNAMRDFMQNLYDGLPIPPPGEEKEPEATMDTELSSTKDIQPLPVHESPQDFDIRQRFEESGIKVYEEQKLKMENTMIELIEDCHQKEILCIHDNVDDLLESSLNSKLLSINSQRLEKKKQEVKNVEEQPFLFMHDNVDDLIESTLESKLLLINSINSQRLDKKEQEVKNVEEQPAERRNHAE
nr:hypothetical protein [Tanacetum cinerariifolium]